ncbi:MAG: PP2C family protein-serine/threonine phosphatase [Terracidiphilus sp.]
MRVTLSSLVRFLRQQIVYIAISAIAGAVFWAIGQEINPLTILVYSIVIGNIVVPVTERSHRFYSQKPFPYNWLFFLAILLVLLIPVYVFSSVVVWLLAPPSPQTLEHLLRTGWKFPVLITFVASVLIFLYQTTKEKLERRNIELQRSVDLGTAQLEMQEQELQRAREIQQSLLPKEIPQLPGFEVAGIWRPARAVSGDYYDVFKLGGHKLGICVADVVGKGVSAALLMANVQAAVHAYASESESAAWLCGKVNTLLYENIAIGKFVTFFYAVLDGNARTLQYCNAGNPYPVLVSRGRTRLLEEGGAVLGVFPSWTYEDATIELWPGDRLLLFTDGITEASGPDEQEFGEANVAEFARTNSSRSAGELNSRLLAHVSAFCGDHFQDDATVVVIAAN